MVITQLKNPGIILGTEEEKQAYEDGKKIFGI